jgi:hypothetical protein
VGVAYLDDWALENYIGETWTSGPEGKGVAKLELTVESSTVRAVDLEDSVKLSLQRHIGIGGRRSTKRHLSQGYNLRIDADAVAPIDDLIDIASDAQDLVSVATGRNAEFLTLSGYHPDLVRRRPKADGEESDEDGVPVPFEVIARWNIRDRAAKPDQIEPHDVYFTFEDLGAMEGIAKWMKAAAEYRSTLGRTMGTRATPNMFVSDRLLNYVAAIEGFDRQKTGRDKDKLPTRLRRCAKLAGGPFAGLVGHVNKWVDAVVDHRNDIAHHLGRRPRGSAAEQHYLSESAYWLAVHLMLREADAPQAVYDRMTEHQHFVYLAPKVKAVATTYKPVLGSGAK